MFISSFFKNIFLFLSRIVNAHQEVVDAFETSLNNSQISFTFYTKSNTSCAFKFWGKPFESKSGAAELAESDDNILYVKALAKIIEKLQTLSWHVVASSDLTKKGSNSTIFFRKISVVDQDKINKLKRVGNIFTFCPSGQNELLFMNVPMEIEKELVEAVR